MENNKLKIVIVGGGGHAKSILSVLNTLNRYEVVGYTDFAENPSLSIPYLGTDDQLVDIRKTVPNAVLGLGMVGLSPVREKLFRMLKSLDYTLPVLIDPTAVVDSTAKIGEGTVVMKKSVINFDAVIGECCIINTGSIVEHDCYIGDFTHLSIAAVLGGGTRVGKTCLVGAGAVIIHGRTIADKVLIGAGACVVKDCLEQGTYLGLPAKLQK